MAKLLCVCLCLCVQLALCQFGFPREERRQDAYNFQQPSRNRNSVSGFHQLQQQPPRSAQGYLYPFNNRQTYDYYGRPITSPNNFKGQQYQEYTSQNGFQNYPNRAQQTYPNEFQWYSQNGPQPVAYGFQNVQPVNQNGFQPNNQNGFQLPNERKEFAVNFPNRNNNADLAGDDRPNNNGLIVITQETPVNNEPGNDREGNGNASDTLIVVPNDGSKSESAFTPNGANGVVFPDEESGQEESTRSTEATVTTKATEATATAKADEATTELPASPVLPPLTPVPDTEKRNNFNFGSSGIFQETCQTVNNEIGSCVLVAQCQPYLQLIQESRNNAQAVQVLRRAHCGFVGSQPKVCCPRPGIPTAPPTPAPTTPSTTTTSEAIIMPKETETNPERAGEAVTIPEAPICGSSNASSSRVVNGVPAKLGDFPWMALLGYKGRRQGAAARWLCGGSLITARHVLTAAHCIHNHEEDLYLVRLGELDLARDDEGATPTDVLIKKQVKHDEYSPKSFTNDIGILLLARTVQFTDLIKPICLPRSTELRARNFVDYNPLIAGWGDTEFRGPAATHLQVLQLPVVSNEFCANAYSAYTAQVIDGRVLCAGYKKGGRDACQGDSGGPLMQPIVKNQPFRIYFYQIGVVSYGRKCAEAGFPGVYTRVTEFVPWIETTVANNV